MTHIDLINNLPTLHKDPFDRLLIAQAQSEGLVFLTSDNILKKIKKFHVLVGMMYPVFQIYRAGFERYVATNPGQNR